MISELRDQLATLLREPEDVAGLVYDTVPEEPQPPCAIIQPAEDFISEDPLDSTFAGDLLVSFDVELLVELDDEHDNATATRRLDQAIDQLVDRLAGTDWWLVNVGQPGTLVTTYWQHHGVQATVRTRHTP